MTKDEARYEVITSRRTSRFTSYAIYDHKLAQVQTDFSTRDKQEAQARAEELNNAWDIEVNKDDPEWMADV